MALPFRSVRRPSGRDVEGVLWPAPRLGEAVHGLARFAGLPTSGREVLTPPADLNPDEIGSWIEAAADRGGIQADQAILSLNELPARARRAAPFILRVRGAHLDGFLAVLSARSDYLMALSPELRRQRLPLAGVTAILRESFEQSLAVEIAALVEKMPITTRRRHRVRAALLDERLQSVRLRSCWTLRLPVGAPVAREAREYRLLRGGALLACAHLAQYLLFVLSWWLLGRGLLSGTIDRGWILGWILLLVSLIPFRLLATWIQGRVSTTMGAALRRRLLRGALRIDRAEVRSKGAGQLFGTIVDVAAIESLALTGGVSAGFSVLELLIAGAVLWTGAGWLPTILLACWVAAATAFGWRYVRRRRAWTGERLALTSQLLESMIGHRTRLAQQPASTWHVGEDVSLAQYVERGRAMDRSTIWLSAFIPRGWLTLSLVSLAPAILAHTSPARIAITVGGILLAHRSLRRLSSGLSNLAGAAIAGQSILPLARAAARDEIQPHPSIVVSHRTADRPASSDATVLHGRDLVFRYPRRSEPVLQGCSLVVARGGRLILDGASGAGKTTLASILAGLEQPDGGLLLVDGLDRSVLGRAGWRQRVVMAPQAHDNYLVTGSLAFNLLMGRRWPAQPVDLAEAEQVSRELGLGELLDRMPGGLHQMVGETGWQLSQGERTRVFLARALLQRPELLVLDESFSALDPENVDRSIRCVLHRAPTVLAIAHA